MVNLFLIQILKDHLNNQPTVLPQNMNLSSLIDCAKKQNLEGIVYYQTKIPQIKESYAATLYNYTNSQIVLNNLEKALQQSGIEYFLVKGFSISSFYPRPQFRTMGDCDIVVHTRDKDKVHDLMLSLDAECVSQGSHEWKYYRKRMEFEIHDHLIYEDTRNPKKAVEFFNTAWSYVKENSLDWNFHFLFLLYHLRKHIMGEGAGIRQFMDLAVVIRNVDLDWNKIKTAAEYLDMTAFCEHVFMLLKSWFDVETPVFNTTINDEFVEPVTQKILDDGVFGFGNEENRSNHFAYEIQKNGRFYSLRSVLFPPYNRMITMEKYKFLRGKKYFLPVAWVYRIILKWKKRDQLKERYMIPSDKVNARMAYLKQWGL